MVQLKHNITGKINQMSEKQYNKMIALGQTFPNYTRVIDTKKLVTKIEKELKENEPCNVAFFSKRTNLKIIPSPFVCKLILTLQF